MELNVLQGYYTDLTGCTAVDRSVPELIREPIIDSLPGKSQRTLTKTNYANLDGQCPARILAQCYICKAEATGRPA